MINKDKALRLLGLSVRAGKTVSGEFSTEKAVKSKKARLVLVASDASDNTKKKFTNMCQTHGVPLLETCDKEGLGKAMGKEYRSCAAVLDENFANAIIKESYSDRERS